MSNSVNIYCGIVGWFRLKKEFLPMIDVVSLNQRFQIFTRGRCHLS